MTAGQTASSPEWPRSYLTDSSQGGDAGGCPVAFDPVDEANGEARLAIMSDCASRIGRSLTPIASLTTEGTGCTDRTTLSPEPSQCHVLHQQSWNLVQCSAVQCSAG